jgi:hypothetical protein
MKAVVDRNNDNADARTPDIIIAISSSTVNCGQKSREVDHKFKLEV